MTASPSSALGPCEKSGEGAGVRHQEPPILSLTQIQPLSQDTIEFIHTPYVFHFPPLHPLSMLLTHSPVHHLSFHLFTPPFSPPPLSSSFPEAYMMKVIWRSQSAGLGVEVYQLRISACSISELQWRGERMVYARMTDRTMQVFVQSRKSCQNQQSEGLG